ncbi:MAG: biotin--[acetyl-CoA-carboxylase] ligase [Gammaproteobacteria bacterium]|nr:biotin--[acetyl-CoA-carboxylase] ligase [Gammaproteobacteria bacterium]
MTNLNSEYQLFKSLCHCVNLKSSTIDNTLLKQIKRKGLNISISANSCSLIEPVIPLSENEIKKNLNATIEEEIEHLIVLYQTDSTNKTILKQASKGLFSVLVTEYQTAGQGRRTKLWHSPLAANLYMSVQFTLQDTKNAQLLPLLTAISICNALKNIGITGLQIKWPNDIYYKGKKLAGILVECQHKPTLGSIFVIGIGLNVNMKINDKIDQEWTSLYYVKNKYFDRNQIISEILSELVVQCRQLDTLNLDLFMEQWSLYDYLHGKPILIDDNEQTFNAVAHGISKDGALLIKEHKKSELKKLYSAEVSIKAKK